MIFPTNKDNIAIIISLISLFVSGLTYISTRESTKTVQQQYVEGKLLVFAGEFDRGNENLILKPLNPKAKIQTLVVYFPKERFYVLHIDKLSLSKIREEYQKENFKTHPYGSPLFFPSVKGSRNYDSTQAKDKRMIIPMNSKIPVIIKTNYIIDGKMFATLGLYKIAYEFQLPGVFYTLNKDLDFIIEAKTYKDIGIHFNDFYYLKQLDHEKDFRRLNNILAEYEERPMEFLDDYGIKKNN